MTPAVPGLGNPVRVLEPEAVPIPGGPKAGASAPALSHHMGHRRITAGGLDGGAWRSGGPSLAPATSGSLRPIRRVALVLPGDPENSLRMT